MSNTTQLTEEQIPQEKEKELTPLAELIDFIDFEFAEDADDWVKIIRERAVMLLPSERQAIEEAEFKGYSRGFQDGKEHGKHPF